MRTYLCFLIIGCLCLSCQTPKDKTSFSQKQLQLSFRYDPITIDPRKNADPISCSVISMLYEGLTHLEPDGSVSMALAESVEISKNNTLYTFYLKKAYWSNGDPITSYDIEFSWKTMLGPSFNSPNAYSLYTIKNARLIKLGLMTPDTIGFYAENDRKFSIQLEQPNPYFLKMLAFVTFFPIKKDTSYNRDSETLPISSGPFVLTQWQPGNFLTLKKNPFFWNSDVVHIDKIRINIIPDEHVAFKLYELHEVDLLGSFLSPIPLEELNKVSAFPQTITSDCAGTSLCFFNIHSFPFGNVNIRKAFSYAIHKQAIIDHISQNHELPAYGLVPPILKHNKQAKFIPEHSKELARHYFEIGLRECGLKLEEFPKLTFSFYNATLEKTIGLALQQQWKDVLAVDVALECADVKIFLDKLYKKNYQFALMPIAAHYFDPMNFLERFFSSSDLKNFCCWENSEFQHLVEISYDATSEEERFAILEQAESILMNEAPIAPIYHHKTTLIKNENILGIEISPIGSIDFRKTYFSATQTTSLNN